ncbi:nonmuscle myosin heavy chain b [Phaffia rhodozyma]|uniref:Nonmuscle myosin heavy chain b n=1 Tax=Phaffia rhodozyma TaxID=264483 RepID=A0A0F7SKE8_PHARH|nr:nonmuscle myosin heavy chain b [Phaffia rhodozyma]
MPIGKERDAEFAAKKWVWVPDVKEGYLGGWISKELESEHRSIVTLAESNQTVTMPNTELSDMNPPRFDNASDIADLTYLNEASVVHNLRQRYSSGQIYTYSSIFLVAVNPYRSLPIYSQAHIDKYRNRRREDNEPHIFAVAERAWVNMRDERESQSVLITGESGAGKTENTKKVIQYLAAIATSSLVPHPSSSAPPFLQQSISLRSASTVSKDSLSSSQINGNGNENGSIESKGLLEQQILQCNPILEAFGNAQTMRNNNSSRFGKFVRIFFAPSGAIAGANVDWYLLEKSRVAFRSEGERSFHVFYMLLAGCKDSSSEGARLRESLLLDGRVESYEYLNKSRHQIDGVNDFEEWTLLRTALDVVGFTPDREQADLFRIIAAILHIGNIQLQGDRTSQAQISSLESLEKACHLLGIPPSEFSKAVTRPRVKAGREIVVQARTKQQTVDELASLCKTIYEKTFGKVVERVNLALDRPKDHGEFIGVLDIAGFEIFETNSFEQLCINYTNEKLQQFFNHHMFVLEQEEYAREAIEWDYVDFGHDLQSTIELIEGSVKQPIGIFSCLDEECIMPQASDVTFLNKLTTLWAPSSDPKQPPSSAVSGSGSGTNGSTTLDNSTPSSSPSTASKFGTIRFHQGFTVQHYAGKVEYRTTGWLDKNKDPLNSNITSLLASSTNKFVAGLFSEFQDPSTPGGTISSHDHSSVPGARRVKTGAFRTVAQRHQEQLTKLMNQLESTQPHFVRCIVPNRFKQPGKIDVPLVLDQLRCNGVLEGIRIARRGYPNRLPFAEFRQRYELLTPGAVKQGFVDGRQACQSMIDSLELDPSVVKLGKTKVFFKVGVLADLQERLDGHLFELVAKFQANARRFIARRRLFKILNRDAAVRTIQRNARLHKELREWPWWQLFTTVQPLLAATRTDQELQRRNAELLFAQERADREEAERINLQTLRLQLESDKRDVQADLEAERTLRLSEASIHERTINQLQQETDDIKADIDTLITQLERAQDAKLASETQSAKYRQDYEGLLASMTELEAERNRLKQREASALEDVRGRSTRVHELEGERDEANSKIGEIERNLKASLEDLVKSKARYDSLETQMKTKIQEENKRRLTEENKVTDLERDITHAKEQLAQAATHTSSIESRLKAKTAELAQFQSDLSKTESTCQSFRESNNSLQASLQSISQDASHQKDIALRETQARIKIEREIDDLRATMGSEESRHSEAAKSKDLEISSLRNEVAKLETELAQGTRVASEMNAKLTLELETTRRDIDLTTRKHAELEDSFKAQKEQLSRALKEAEEAEGGKKTAVAEFSSLQSRVGTIESTLADSQREKETLERQLSRATKKNQDYEDAIVSIEREKANWAAQMAEFQRRADKEQQLRLQLEDAQLRHSTEKLSLQDRLSQSERQLAKVNAEFNQLYAETKILRSRENKTIVEHVYVLEAAKRISDRQLAEARSELQSLKVYVKSLEKARTSSGFVVK